MVTNAILSQATVTRLWGRGRGERVEGRGGGGDGGYTGGEGINWEGAAKDSSGSE